MVAHKLGEFSPTRTFKGHGTGAAAERATAVLPTTPAPS
jgi:ribosomal protein S19